jgi:predicted dehydrogenase
MVKKMKFLFVGLGSIGQRHLRNIKKLKPNSQILAYRKLNRKIHLNNNQKLLKTNINTKYKIKLFTDYNKALAERPDAVFICNPTSEHVKYAIKAAKKKINIFIDKPISHNLKNLKNLKKVVKKNKIIFFVGYQLRFSKPLNFIKKIIEKGDLGKLCGANIYNGEFLPDYHKYEDYKITTMAQKKLGGGVINSQIHELDYCHYLFGKSKKLFAKVGKYSQFKINVEDYMNSLIIFQKDNIAVNLVLDFFQRPPVREMLITGSKKSLKWYYYKNKIELFNYLKNKKNVIKFGKFNRNEMFINQTKYFLNLLKKRKLQNISDIDNAIETIKLSEDLKSNL